MTAIIPAAAVSSRPHSITPLSPVEAPGVEGLAGSSAAVEPTATKVQVLNRKGQIANGYTRRTDSE